MDAATSREALAAVRDSVASLGGQVSGEVSGQLFSVVKLFDGERTLRRTLADGSTKPSARAELLKNVLKGKVSDTTLEVVVASVQQQWSSPADLVDALELIGREALLRSAQDAGQLDAVEDELFRLARIVEGNPALERALGDRTADTEGQRELVANLLSGKTTDITSALVDQLIARQREELVEGIDDLASLAAKQREKSVAEVRSAVLLTAEQEERLAASLSRTYGREVTLHVEVDPTLTGGLVIQVGDEVIDGSIAGRLESLRRKLAG